MSSVEKPRIMLAGSVNSSRKTLEKLYEHNMDVVGVLGLEPTRSKFVSGYNDLRKYIDEGKTDFLYFQKINSDKVIEFTEKCRPDYLFVVGLSQLIREPLLSLPAKGCIGFHPTKLPEGRGRGAVAWLILGKAPGASTFFLIGEGMDDGPILVQKEFEVDEDDYAVDVIDKITDKIDCCLDQLLPEMKAGNLHPVKQDHSKATFLGKRNPEDGLINWQSSAEEIVRLIRAVSEPLPGAFSFIKDKKIIVDKASTEKSLKYIGVTGRILKKDPVKGALVQAGNGLVWLQDIRGISFEELKVGQKFYSCMNSHVNIEKAIK